MHKRISLPVIFSPALSFSLSAAETATKKRIEEVATCGAHVMPFSLDRTRHIFTKINRGGVQEVVARSATDTEQISLIRQHLLALSQALKRGDFSDPEKIHGADMPGLAELRSAPPGQLVITYRELPMGARIDYSTADARIVSAIHAWFDAQLHDHAHHAMAGHRRRRRHDHMQHAHKQHRD